MWLPEAVLSSYESRQSDVCILRYAYSSGFSDSKPFSAFLDVQQNIDYSRTALSISERRQETRREASRRSTQRASCHSHMGKQNDIITREILILDIWFIEQKVIVFRCRTDIRGEPARP